MHCEPINAPIDILCNFIAPRRIGRVLHPARVVPIKFYWSNREYVVREIIKAMTLHPRPGVKELNFAIRSDSSDVFHIAYNSKQDSWTLKSVTMEG